jgi:hypothetical protein
MISLFTVQRALVAHQYASRDSWRWRDPQRHEWGTTKLYRALAGKRVVKWGRSSQIVIPRRGLHRIGIQ